MVGEPGGRAHGSGSKRRDDAAGRSDGQRDGGRRKDHLQQYVHRRRRGVLARHHQRKHGEDAVFRLRVGAGAGRRGPSRQPSRHGRGQRTFSHGSRGLSPALDESRADRDAAFRAQLRDLSSLERPCGIRGTGCAVRYADDRPRGGAGERTDGRRFGHRRQRRRPAERAQRGTARR